MRRDGGKGDKPRPIPNREQFESNWDNIFKAKQKKEPQYPAEVIRPTENQKQ